MDWRGGRERERELYIFVSVSLRSVFVIVAAAGYSSGLPMRSIRIFAAYRRRSMPSCLYSNTAPSPPPSALLSFRMEGFTGHLVGSGSRGLFADSISNSFVIR